MNVAMLQDEIDNEIGVAVPSVQRLAVLFPGQGSQTVGMLADWAETYPQVKTTFSQASDVLGFDLWAIAQGTDSLRSLDDTAFTQPALLTASMAIWRILIEEFELKPAYLAGHSLGEYSALCAAGVLSLTDAVTLVHERGKLMTQAVSGQQGKMAAVLGLDDDQVRTICEMVMETHSEAIVSPANFNSPGQVVIAGNEVGVNFAMEQVAALGNKSMALKVSVPSHCQLMQLASEQLAKRLNAIDFATPQIPVLQNRHARVETDVNAIKQALIEQLSQPVLWSKTEDVLAAKHMSLQIECGSGNVLTNLAKRQNRKIETIPTDKVVRLEKIREVVNH